MNQPSREQIEARLTALLLGELPADEAELLRFTISQDAALKKLHDELASTIVLVREAAKTPGAAHGENSEALKLSEARRKQLLAHFQTPRQPEPLFWLKPIKIPNLVTALAVVALVAVVAAMFLPALASSKKKAQKISAANFAKQQTLEMEYAKPDDLHANTASMDQSLTPLAVAGDFPAAPSAAPAVVTVSPAPVIAPPPVIAKPSMAIVLPPAEVAEQIQPDTGLLAAERKPAVMSQNKFGYVNQSLALADQSTAPQAEPRDEKSFTASLDGSVKTRLIEPQLGNVGWGISKTISKVSEEKTGRYELAEEKSKALAWNSTIDSESTTRRRSLNVNGGAVVGTVNSFGGGGAGGGGGRGTTSAGGTVLALPDYSANNSPQASAPVGAVDATVAFDDNGARPQLSENSSTITGNGRFSPAFKQRKLEAENSDQLLTSGLKSSPKQMDVLGSDLQQNEPAIAGNNFYRNPTLEAVKDKAPVLGDVPMVGRLFASSAAATLEPTLVPAESSVTGDRSVSGKNFFMSLDDSQLVAKSGNSDFDRDVAKDSFKTGLSKDDAAGLNYLIITNAVQAQRLLGVSSAAAESREMEVDRISQEAARKKLIETDKPRSQTKLPALIPQPEILCRENNFSTFSLNVSDVSFKLAAASLERGQMPDAAAIRSEEFINAFDYRDSEAAAGQPLAFASERARYPFAQNRELLRFSVKTAALGRPAGRALNLVLLLDNSGSMERADRVTIIREALRGLATQLQPQDTVSVVTFARTARLWVDGVSGDTAGAVFARVGGITPEGGTNLEEAMRLAYETARRHYLANGMNRVVLLTDGAANLGDVNPADLKQKVEAQRKQGIALDCFGIGFEDYNDDLLEQLSRNGDGRYAFINTAEDAGKEFAAKLAGALQVAASDVKVQVEFNPQRVISWRQIGYAKHQLTKEQFRDNTVDAAEIAAQEAGNALYTVETKADGNGPIATVRVRYKVPGTTDYRERSWDVAYTGNAVALEQSSAAMKLAATASAFSEWLASSPFAQEVTPDELLKTMSGVPQIYGADQRPKKLEWMIRQAKSLSGK